MTTYNPITLVRMVFWQGLRDANFPVVLRLVTWALGIYLFLFWSWYNCDPDSIGIVIPEGVSTADLILSGVSISFR